MDSATVSRTVDRGSIPRTLTYWLWSEAVASVALDGETQYLPAENAIAFYRTSSGELDSIRFFERSMPERTTQ